jgi:hypothetical protein
MENKIILKLFLTFFIAMSFVILIDGSAFAGWLIFHKPAFKGKVIDFETKEPIEGAVVVIVYKKHVYGPAGGYSSVVKVKETLTDENGEFIFSSYLTIIHPFSRENYADFIIYKPGYGSFPKNKMSPPSGMGLSIIEMYFMAENFGQKKKVRILEIGKEDSLREVTFGLVELPPLKNRTERLRAAPGGPTDLGSKELPLLFKALNDERKGFGLKPVGRPSK